MRTLLYKLQIPLLLFAPIFLTFTIYHCIDHTDCKTPHAFFNTCFPIICLALNFSRMALESPNLSRFYRKLLKNLDDFLLYPITMYLFVQGIIWLFRIELSPACQLAQKLPWEPWLRISMTFLFAARCTYLKYRKFKYWWIFRQFNQNPDNFSLMLLEAGDLNDRLGLSISDIWKLEKRNFSQQLEQENKLDPGPLETCSICYEDYCFKDRIVFLPKCGHLFHWKCVARWLLRSPLCPLCRNNVRNALYGGAQSFNQMSRDRVVKYLRIFYEFYRE